MGQTTQCLGSVVPLAMFFCGNVCIFVLMHLWYSIVEQRSFAVLAVCVTGKLLQLMASSIAHKLTQYRQYNLFLENNTFLGLQRKIYLF